MCVYTDFLHFGLSDYIPLNMWLYSCVSCKLVVGSEVFIRFKFAGGFCLFVCGFSKCTPKAVISLLTVVIDPQAGDFCLKGQTVRKHPCNLLFARALASYCLVGEILRNHQNIICSYRLSELPTYFQFRELGFRYSLIFFPGC